MFGWPFLLQVQGVVIFKSKGFSLRYLEKQQAELDRARHEFNEMRKNALEDRNVWAAVGEVRNAAVSGPVLMAVEKVLNQIGKGGFNCFDCVESRHVGGDAWRWL